MRTAVIPHTLEVSGRITNAQNTFDTTWFVTYAGGVASGGGEPVADLYLFDQALGRPSSQGSDACGPCKFSLASKPARKRLLRVEDLLPSSFTGVRGPVLGYGIIVVAGADPNAVNLQGFVTNARTSAFDLSVFGFEPVPLEAVP